MHKWGLVYGKTVSIFIKTCTYRVYILCTYIGCTYIYIYICIYMYIYIYIYVYVYIYIYMYIYIYIYNIYIYIMVLYVVGYVRRMPNY